MSDDDKTKRAKEIEDAIKRADAGEGVQLDKVLEKMDAFCNSMGKRMDALELEAKNKTARRPGETRQADGDDDDLNFDELPEGEQERLIAEEVEREPGAARETAADSARKRYDETLRGENKYERERRRDAARLGHQAVADAVYQEFGKNAPGPLAGEPVRVYRRRLLRDLIRFSPAYKNVDLGTLHDARAFAVAERQIRSDALAEARRPTDVMAGTLRQVTKKIGPHTHVEFYGQPSAWINQFAGPVRQNVTKFNVGKQH